MAHQVSCHCGHLKLEVDAPLNEVVECNCSICTRSGFLHWYVPPELIELDKIATLEPEKTRDSLATGTIFSLLKAQADAAH